MTVGGRKFDKLPDSLQKHIIKNTIFPKYKPAFRNFMFDSENNVLVFPVERPSFFYAFDSKGRYINEVDIIAGEINTIRVWRSKKNSLWFVDFDEKFEQSIVKFSIKSKRK